MVYNEEVDTSHKRGTGMTTICDQPEIDGPDCECLLDLEPVCDFECAILLNGVCFWCKTPTATLAKLEVLTAGDLLPMGVVRG